MDQNQRDKILHKAKLLKALADQGIGGEKTNAQRMLADYIKKYNINPEEIGLANLNYIRRWRIGGEYDMLILNNVIVSINPFAKIINGDKFIQVELDNEDFLEITEKYAYFIKLWRVEMEWLKMGFFHKHKDYFVPDEAVMKKWRAKNSMNPDIEKAKQTAEQVNKVASKINPDKLEKQITEMNEQQKIHALNVHRVDELVPIMLSSFYKRTDKTLEEKKS